MLLYLNNFAFKLWFFTVFFRHIGNIFLHFHIITLNMLDNLCFSAISFFSLSFPDSWFYRIDFLFQSHFGAFNESLPMLHCILIQYFIYFLTYFSQNSALINIISKKRKSEKNFRPNAWKIDNEVIFQKITVELFPFSLLLHPFQSERLKLFSCANAM